MNRTRARSGLFLAIGLLACAGMAAAAPSPQAQREIRALIDALPASGCRFQRNGEWHDGEAARAHLQRKYDYLRRRGLVDSPEQFIERAASRSSVSGRAYRVACQGRPEQPAAAWFGERLQALRPHGAVPPQRLQSPGSVDGVDR